MTAKRCFICKKGICSVLQSFLWSVPTGTQPYTIPKAGVTHMPTPGGCRAAMLDFNKHVGEQ